MRIVDLYRSRLHTVAGVQYTFPFEMKTARQQSGQVGYFLIFASRHHRGLEKMKEAMKRMDQTGRFEFANAWAGRGVLLREDRLGDFCMLMRAKFMGSRASYSELRDFALNETPFLNPKAMLRVLEEQSVIRVDASDPKRKRKSFKEDAIRFVEFLKED